MFRTATNQRTLNMDEMKDQISTYEMDGLKVILITRGHTLTDVLEGMRNVIVGQGYHPEGTLEFVKDYT